MSKLWVAEIVAKFYAERGQGMTRRELADAIGCSQTRNIPGVRRAIADGLIHYDDSPEGRLVPSRSLVA